MRPGERDARRRKKGRARCPTRLATRYPAAAKPRSRSAQRSSGSSDIWEATWTVVLDDLECSVTDCGGVQLRWSNPNDLEYTDVSIRRDGRSISTLDPEDVGFLDEAAPTGLRNYAVIVTFDGATYSLRCSANVTCSDPDFLRGDCNDDGTVDISDAVCILNWLFLGGTAPGCVAVTNTNGDKGNDISDATYLLNHLFLGGTAPVDPFPECGPGTLQADGESCETLPENCPQ